MIGRTQDEPVLMAPTSSNTEYCNMCQCSRLQINGHSPLSVAPIMYVVILWTAFVFDARPLSIFQQAQRSCFKLVSGLASGSNLMNK